MSTVGCFGRWFDPFRRFRCELHTEYSVYKCRQILSGQDSPTAAASVRAGLGIRGGVTPQSFWFKSDGHHFLEPRLEARFATSTDPGNAIAYVEVKQDRGSFLGILAITVCVFAMGIVAAFLGALYAAVLFLVASLLLIGGITRELWRTRDELFWLYDKLEKILCGQNRETVSRRFACRDRL